MFTYFLMGALFGSPASPVDQRYGAAGDDSHPTGFTPVPALFVYSGPALFQPPSGNGQMGVL